MDIVVRAFFAFLFVFLRTRLIGRRELSTLQPFDLLLLVVVGDLLQQGVTQNDLCFTGLVLAVGVFGLLTLALSYGGWRFPRLRPLLEPEARLQKISSLDEVQWAMLESGGPHQLHPEVAS